MTQHTSDVSTEMTLPHHDGGETFLVPAETLASFPFIRILSLGEKDKVNL